jgi:hypothetical protein
MRQLMMIVLAVLSMSFGMGEAFAKKVQFSATANQVYSACTKAGGLYHEQGNKYECSKANCDGKGGSCSVQCTGGNCTGTTPGRVANQSIGSFFALGTGTHAPASLSNGSGGDGISANPVGDGQGAPASGGDEPIPTGPIL